MSNRYRIGSVLWQIKIAHTFAWAVFATTILAIPIVTVFRKFDWASWLSLFVWIEIFILAVHHMRCPLTGIAERYTDDRSDNFDIFLPIWLARINQLIFGSVFIVVEAYLVFRWMSG